MRISNLITLDPPMVSALVQRFADETPTLADASFGEDLPTKMLFAPEEEFRASLHYMFFPRGTCQAFHWHPGGRHLIVIGDTALTVRHNPCVTADNPYDSPATHTVPANTVAAIRFAAATWHEFSSPDAIGTGIVAFSFHDSDDLVSTSASLMEELTTFWQG